MYGRVFQENRVKGQDRVLIVTETLPHDPNGVALKRMALNDDRR